MPAQTHAADVLSRPKGLNGRQDQHDSEEEAQEWLQAIIEAAQAGLSPSSATMKLAECGEANMDLALRGLE
ncbi:hypothetical protein [Streptomyces coeruleorubidus]|uniref:hypothetical protein n=1 Tax=Streptomyces coeruleorubidus TaxID=116188 RepID=UPI0036925909